MIREERFERIRSELARLGVIDGDALASLLGVSRATIRRDLDTLEERGTLKRTHGGAVSADPKDELPFHTKLGVASREKREIGLATARLLPENAVIGCTGGTTVMSVVKALGDKRLTVVTNAINIAMELARFDTMEVVVTGGTLRPRSYELVGHETDETLARFQLDVALLGVDGISLERGISTFTIVEAHAASLYIAQAREVWVVADAGKAGKVAPALIAPISKIHRLITDGGISAELLDGFRAAGLEVLIAERSLEVS
jgi:DeoR/GlpR family transcriptional regulator of sugar metabolism